MYDGKQLGEIQTQPLFCHTPYRNGLKRAGDRQTWYPTGLQDDLSAILKSN